MKCYTIQAENIQTGETHYYWHEEGWIPEPVFYTDGADELLDNYVSDLWSKCEYKNMRVMEHEVGPGKRVYRKAAKR